MNKITEFAIFKALNIYSACEEPCHLDAVFPVPAVKGLIGLPEAALVDRGDVVADAIVALNNNRS